MDKDRRLTYKILKQTEEKGTWSKLAINDIIQTNGADSPAFIRELVYGILRNKYLLDYNIGFYLKKPSLKTDQRIWLRMGFYQLAFMDGVSDYAAVNETVELARTIKKGSEAFINAVLRNFHRDGCVLRYPEKNNFSYYLSVKYSVHIDIVNLWIKYYGLETAEKLLIASNTPAPLCLRANRLKISKKELIDKFLSDGANVSDCSLSNTAFTVSGGSFIDSELFRQGYFAVQGESSQYAIQLLNPAPGSFVIDLCAAPGGKSCLCAEYMRNTGSILALDLYEHRVQLIKKEAKRLNIDIIKAECADAAVFNSELADSADYVIADVPCTGLGTLRENPEIKYRSPSAIPEQRAILENALKYVKKGGLVLYSTCTVNPLENDFIVRDCRIEKSIQLFTVPGQYSGFYICLIRRE